MIRLFAWLLSKLFPPRLPARIDASYRHCFTYQIHEDSDRNRIYKPAK